MRPSATTAVAPLVQIGPNHFLLELFHGPTLAFKDLAMQFLARLMDHVLAERGERATIVGATSGDTGGAAIEAFRGRERIDVAILFPDGRVSPVQRRQMTTAREKNVQAIAIEGTFDDCQALVKAMFNDARFRERVRLSGVNSINWGRIVAQIVYYFAAAVALGAPHRRSPSPCRPATSATSSPATRRSGWACRSSASSSPPTSTTSCTARSRPAATRCAASPPTTSPSMDIQVSSNFERLLFEAEGRDAAAVRRLMAGLAQSGAYTLDQEAREGARRGLHLRAADEAKTGGDDRAAPPRRRHPDRPAQRGRRRGGGASSRRRRRW